MSAPVYIAVEGVIGVGKTTLARLLQPEYEARLLLEVFEENPFLAHFYADRERYAFQTQIFFLLSRYRQQRLISELKDRVPLLTDYLFAKDRLFARLNLGGDEMNTYETLYHTLAEHIARPDLVIYLRASVDVLMARIAARDRPYERGMDRGYIAGLARAYDEFFADYRTSPLLVLDTDDLNVVTDAEDLASVHNRVRAALGQGSYQQSLPLDDLPAPLAGGITTPPQPHPRNGLSDLQAFRQALQNDGDGDLFMQFLLLQDCLGALAGHMMRVRKDLRGPQPHSAALPTLGDHHPGLSANLADCLAALLQLANNLGVDLQDALLEHLADAAARPGKA